ncbi:MAG: hypothetical protein ACK54C_00045 [Betaproteobacteria bacterium]
MGEDLWAKQHPSEAIWHHRNAKRDRNYGEGFKVNDLILPFENWAKSLVSSGPHVGWAVRWSTLADRSKAVVMIELPSGVVASIACWNSGETDFTVVPIREDDTYFKHKAPATSQEATNFWDACIKELQDIDPN